MMIIAKQFLHFIIIATLCSAACGSKNIQFQNETVLSHSPTENTTDYRLPDNIIPTEYFICLTPFIIPGNFTFKGTTKITANVKKVTSKIVLHANLLEINEVNISSVERVTTLLDVENISRTKKYDFLNIFMKSPIKSGTIINIEISYTGNIGTEPDGFFRRSYRLENKTRWIAGTHMQPLGARNVFPCFDEPGLKAVFHLKAVVPSNYTALSNMPAKSRSNDNIIEFEKTPRMSTYTVALVISDFESLRSNESKHLLKTWTSSGLMHQLPYSLSVATKAIEFFESRLAIPYPLPKFDLVAMPDYDTAMENWGLLLFSEKLLLYDAGYTSLTRKKFIRYTIIHEIFHQWAGNLVTPSWWDYLWLSESFATYFGYHTPVTSPDSWNLESQFVVDELQTSFGLDDDSSKPMTRKIYSPEDILLAFDGIVYTKGACILRMLQKLLGREIFYSGLRRYLLKYEYSNTTPELLFTAYEEEIKFNNYKFNTTVAEFMNSWTLQPGFPVLDVHFDGDDVHFKQKRFLLYPSENKTYESIWVIPINYATQSNPDFNNTKVIFLTKNETTITIANASREWVIFNVQQLGYYRVNYDKEIWRRIIKVLKSKEFSVIHEINRASLIDDLLNLGRAGVVDYNTVLSATQYLKQETNYVPWRAAFEGFLYLKKRFAGHSEIYRLFKVYITSLLKPTYKRLGFYDKVEEELLNVHLREYVLDWLCSFEYEECINKSLEEFKQVRQSNSYIVPANQEKLVYCMGIKYGSNEDWNYLWHKFRESNYAIQRMTILSALACSQNSTNLKRLLLSTVTPNDGISQYDIPEVFSYVVKAGEVGVQTTLNFIVQHYNKIRDYTGDESVATETLTSISEHLSTKELLEKFQKWFETNKKTMSNITELLENSLQNSIKEIKWFHKNSLNILLWLKTNSESS